MSMRRGMKRYTCFLGLCLLSLCVCGWENADDQTGQKEKFVDLDEIREEGVVLDSMGQEFEILEYIFEMPEAEHVSEQAAEEIKKWQKEELALFWQAVEEQASVEDDKFWEIKSNPEEEKQIWWGAGYYHVEYSVFESDGLISFLKREYQLYTNAAHEILDDSSVIFDSDTGERVASQQILNRLIGEGEEKRIYLAQYLKEQLHELAWNEYYSDRLVYKILYQPECYVKRDTLVVFFDTYDIAVYAAGDIFLEVPFHKLDRLEEEIIDKSSAKERIRKLDKPGGQNGYLIEIAEGETVRADLDGDGGEEVLFYPLRKEPDKDNHELTITVNGKKIDFPLEEKAERRAIALVDLDKEDGEYELAVRTGDKDVNPETVFFGYYDKELKEVGRTGFWIDRETINDGKAWIRGDGFVSDNEEVTEIRKESNAEDKVIVEGLKEEGSRMDSFYQESLLLNYEFSMPSITCQGEQAAEKIKEWQAEEFDAFMQKMEELALDADSDCLERLISQDGWGVPCIYSVKYDVFESEGAVSLLKDEFQCYGPSHGSTTNSGIVFDNSTGERLSIDYFLDGEENQCIALAQYLIEQVDREHLIDNYKEDIVHKVVFDPQFYVDGDTLVFLFSQDELASHAYGPIFLKVPLKTQRAVEDREAIEKWTEELQIPGRVNRYLVEVPSGQRKTVDLDGDGQEEEIYYQEEKSAVENISSKITVTIGGKKFQLTVDENIVRESIGLVDIDKEDGKYELAVRAAGSSDDYVTAFYRYDSGEIREIGRIGCIIDRDSIDLGEAYLHGNGEIYGSRVLGILEIRQVNDRWKLDADTDLLVLQEKEKYDYFFKDWTEPFAGWRWERPYKLTGGILVYDQMDRASECRIVTGEDTRIIQFLSTDGKNWVETELFTDGEFKRGWVYLLDSTLIEVEKGQFKPCSQCIENLQRAG
ncbi:MAG: RsiV family protein [Lachnospiraceae bacterium]|nr:RsiV family protein [Lachnospiraceae bacterium]